MTIGLLADCEEYRPIMTAERAALATRNYKPDRVKQTPVHGFDMTGLSVPGRHKAYLFLPAPGMALRDKAADDYCCNSRRPDRFHHRRVFHARENLLLK